MDKLIAAVSALVLASSATPSKQQVEVVSHLVGTMATSVQAAADPEIADVRMTTCRVSVVDDESDSVFLYQEQALSERLAQPYRQRILEIVSSEDAQMVVSKSYKPTNSKVWVNFCDQPEAQRQVQPSALGEEVCSVFLKPLITVYVGNTPPGGCEANVRGAVKITNTIVLHSDGMDTYDRGFDAEGNQVWGAADKSYQFRWLE